MNDSSTNEPGTPQNQQPITPKPAGAPNLPPRPPQPAFPRPMTQRKTSRTGLWVLLGLLGVGAVFFIGIFVLLIMAAMNNGGGSGGTLGMHEERIDGTGTKKIAQIEIKGIILPQQASLFGGGNMVERAKRQIRLAANDPDVVAILLVVDSPGGGVTASDELWNEVKRAHKLKKIVVHTGNLCASGGYYVSAPADHIVASPTTVTGSIGVIMSLMDLSALMQEKLGVKENNITSGPYKDIGSIGRPMTQEERAILQTIVDDMHSRFVEVVTEGRAGHGSIPADKKEAEATVRKLADGRIYTATQALENGLVDEIGYLEDAQAAARTLTGQADAKVFRYRRQLTFMDILSGDVDAKINVNAGLQVDAGSFLQMPQFLYLWSPGR